MISNSLGYLGSSTLGTLDRILSLSNSIPSSSLSALTGTEAGVNSTINDVSTTLSYLWNNEVNGVLLSTSLASTTTQLSDLQKNVTLFGSTTDNVEQLITSFVVLANTLQQQAINFSTMITEMNQARSDSVVGVYRLTAAHQFATLNLSNLVPSDLLSKKTNISASVDLLRTLPLGSLSTNLKSNYSNAYNKSFESISNISASVLKSIRNSRPTVVKNSNQVNSSIYDIAGAMPTTVSNTFITILKYDSYRTYVVGIFFGVAALVVMIALLCIKTKKPGGARRCTVTSLILWSFLMWIGIIHLILATVLGEFCPILFTEGGSSLTGVLGPVIPAFLGGMNNARDQCSRNVSLLRIASNFGIIDYSTVNITEKVADSVKSTNWSAVTESIGSSSSNNILNYDIANVTVYLINGVHVATIANLTSQSSLNKSQTTIPSTTIANYLTNLISYTNSERSNFATNYFTYSPVLTGAAQTARVNAIAQIYTTSTDYILGNYSIYLDPNNPSSTLSRFLAARDNLLSQLVSLNSTSTALSKNASILNVQYRDTANAAQRFSNLTNANITGSIPLFKMSAIRAGNTSQNALENSMTCSSVAEEVYAMQESICSVSMIGLDSVWLALLVICITGFMAIPVYGYACKVLIAPRRIVYPEEQNEVLKVDPTPKSLKKKKTKQEKKQIFADDDLPPPDYKKKSNLEIEDGATGEIRATGLIQDDEWMKKY